MIDDHFPFYGLTETEVLNRLKTMGFNEIPEKGKRNTWTHLISFFKEPMIFLLFFSALIYLIIGDWTEGLLLGLSIFVVAGISYYQKRKSDNALKALRDLSSPRALAIREGIEKRIAAKELVPGDLISLHEGDRVPADGVILQTSHLSVDESLLTGESFSVEKTTLYIQRSKKETEKKDNHHIVFSGTLVISGMAIVRVTRTGIQTEMGKIGTHLESVENENVGLKTEIGEIVSLFAWSGLVICTLVVVLYGLTRGDWMQGFLMGLATEMALLPEEFPVIFTIFLAMGAWRLSRIQVLVRDPGAIERLGSVSALCVDKTGTLTFNQMTISQISNFSNTHHLPSTQSDDLPSHFCKIIEYGILASHTDPFDPMEKALRRLAVKSSWGQHHLHDDWELVRNYPLSKKLLAMSCVWKNKKKPTEYVIAAKGAPETIIDLCHLAPQEIEQINHSIQEMAKAGLRILGVANASFPSSTLPDNQHEFEFQWVGLIGFEDPLRPEVPNAVERCHKAGIRVFMMTGDYPVTADKIAQQAGISSQNTVVTGAQLSQMTDQEIQACLEKVRVFARMVPEQKLRVVKVLKKMGYVVAMTGDGVNDAPSLKWANVGIAMGGRGTDVAREASDIVLLDDNFSSIVAGIERGRVIFENIKKAMGYVASIHIPIAGLAILPVLLGWPFILFPAHIVFLELIIDPVCSLLFESEGTSKKVMRRPPRLLGSRLFTKQDLVRSFLQGCFILILLALIFGGALFLDNGEGSQARSITFVTLVMINVGLIFSDISGGSISILRKLFLKISNYLIIFGILLALFVCFQIPTLSKLFRFSPLSMLEFLFCAGISIFVFLIIFLWNLVENKSKKIKSDKGVK
jgi:Ca2+-transporting ATPase